MFAEIQPIRVANMTPLERRWLDNIKKAFADSDHDFLSARMADDCIETLFKGIDAAKSLRLSLKDVKGNLSQHNRQRFIEFIQLEIPTPGRSRRTFTLKHARDGRPLKLSVAEILYDIRCMIHENENLNEVEPVDYHILLRWDQCNHDFECDHSDGRLVLNARFLWRRLREILSKFITGLEALNAMARNRGFHVTIRPEMGSIQPDERTRLE
jgi:hypothetical protein